MLKDALLEIQQSFGYSQMLGTLAEIKLRRREDDMVLRTLPKDLLIWKLEAKDWNQVYGADGRGTYLPFGCKVLLNDEKWCRKTMIHESLHRMSIFSHPNNWLLKDSLELFAEGTTEFLTGLLLWKKHKKCYENWLSGRFNQWCSVSYSRETKTIFAFCACANIDCLKDLFFGTGSKTISVAWSGFVTAIQKSTGKIFKRTFKEGKEIGLSNAFKRECERQYGREFRKRQKLLDYSIF